MISWLLEAGATVDAVDDDGRKPLLYAMANKDAVTIKLLHAAGADKYEYGIEDMRSLVAPTLDGSSINWRFGKSVVFELPRWQFDWVTARQPLFMEENSTSQEVAKAISQCELEIGLISKQRESNSDGEETPLETVIGLAYFKTVLGYAIANGMDFQTAQTKVSAMKDSREA